MKGILSALFNRQSDRSREVAKNIALSVGARGVSILISLMLVPMTIDYLNPEQYGIWLSLAQIIAWVAYFDIGLGNGFRNKYAKAKAEGDMVLARQYLSTTYFAITCLVSFLFLIILIINSFIDWSRVLKIDGSYVNELRDVFAIVCGFFCLNTIANVFSMLLSADQKPGYSSVISAAGQMISLAVIFILTKFTEGSLTNLALYFSGIPCIVMLLSSIYAFTFTDFKKVRPQLKMIRPDLIRDIISLGVKFFVICVSMIAIFQVTNIVLSREIGPESVTEYNVAYKYFNVLYTIMILVINPYWSAFTDAYAKKDFEWMKSSVRRLEMVWILSVAVGIVMLAVSSVFFRIWIQDKVEVPVLLSIGVLVLTLSQILGNIYMYMINGIGTIRIQLVIYLLMAIIAWPLLSLSCRIFGVAGIIIVPTLTYLFQAVLSKIQLGKLLNNRAEGWWCK